MISKAWNVARHTLLRTTLIVGFATASIFLVGTTHLFATALLAALLCFALSLDLYRVIASADRPAAPIGADKPEIRSNSEYLQALLDTVSSVLMVLDDHGQTALANRAAQKFAGMPVRRLEQIPKLGEAAALKIRAMAPGGAEVLRLADGQFALVTAGQFRSSENSSLRLISLQRVAGDLDAVEIKAWRDMMQVLTHEMMNSLTPITSLTESLASILSKYSLVGTSLPAVEFQSIVETIGRRSQRLMEFVERYRRVAELPRPVMQTVSAAEFFRQSEELLNAMAFKANVSYRCDIDPSVLSFRADPLLLEQALLNLLKNSFDATGGEVQGAVIVSCTRTDSHLLIDVADNGRGVDQATREHLFVPFFSTKPGGSGIGLNLARNIALAHGGTLTFEANIPKGSIFRMILPILSD
jgi:two-component system, NtrC family, nitrogen regulation sensor histidine kinase NtrY